MVQHSNEIETLATGTSEPNAELTLGQSFAGRYRIERFLGRGSMGTVYAAHDTAVDEPIALKLLALPRTESIERFGREVRLARRVTHRNTARTFDLGEHEGVHFITMELVDGDSLRVLLAQRGRLEAREVMDIGQQLALGLHAAHEVGVIHRDLKPANALIERNGRVVITDFGVACTTAEETKTTDERPKLAGTPLYMAPEQVVGAPLDTRADLYSLGALLYELLTGKPAFTGMTRTEIAMARLTQPPPDPRLEVEVPDALADLVLRCMALEPEKRPTGAQQIAQDLVDIGLGRTPAIAIDRGDASSTDLGSEMFISTSPGDQALAVMSFRYRGPKDEEYLAEVLTDELVDLLAMTKGLRVSSSGAANRFQDERDASTIGRALGVNAIIDGTIQRGRDRIRIVARLIDVYSGYQRWSERFEGRLEDVFELQDRMAKRVAEALRLEISVLGQGRLASGKAIELYLRGRQRVRESDVSGQRLEEGIALFEQALKQSPGFGLALAARADATLRRWFLPSARNTGDWGEASRAAVLAALNGASDVAEAQLAAARLHVSCGEFEVAARHLTAALDIAPTYAAAHEYLGILQCDAGRSKEGVHHIELAHELDPSLHQGSFSVLRQHALRGSRSNFEKQLARMYLAPSTMLFVLCKFEFRLWLWFDDPQRARAVRWRNDGAEEELDQLLLDALDADRPHQEIASRFDVIIERQASPRLQTAWRQIAAEVLAWRGGSVQALEQIAQADALGVLLDADWFESCPVLREIRSDPSFVKINDRVRARADAIWRTTWRLSSDERRNHA